MTAANVVGVPTHAPALVALSIGVSLLAAYSAGELAQRMRDARGRAWLAWFGACSLALGLGSWSVHYTGLLAAGLPGPIELDGPVVLLSLLVGVAGGAAALLIGGRSALGGAVVLSVVSISGLHETMMAGMRLPRIVAAHDHSPLLVVSTVIGSALLFFAMRIRARHIAILLAALVNPAMHYAAMAGLAFARDGGVPEADLINLSALGIVGVSIVPAAVLVAGLLASFADRLLKQRALQEDLFQQARDAVALLTGDYRVVRVNRAFTALFGYGPECAGRPLEELIVPPEERLFFERNRAEAEAGRRVEAEGLRRRKDGAIIPVSITLRRVSVPAEGVDICAIYVDISERKAAEEARRAFPGRLIEMQELERKHIARELHDEIGQVLTSATMILNLSRQLPAVEAQKRTVEACALLDELVGKVRGLALDLRPSVLDHFGLAAALTGFFQRFTAQTGVHVVFRDFDTDGRRFSSEIETAAYRIVQEALTNVARHAKVREATVTLLAEDRFLRIEVEDRGEGFDTREACATEAFGLNGMRERSALLGGRFIVHTSLGSGTRIVAELPLPASGWTG